MKDKQETPDSRLRQFQEELPVHERIRNRRETRQLTGAELAKLAGVSPAYVSLIERGFRVPAEHVALAIAQTLEDDPELYLHWARAGRDPTTSDARRRYDAITADAHLRHSLAAGDDLPLHRINLLARATASTPQKRERMGGPFAIELPVLPWGVDPGRPGTPLLSTPDTLWADTRLLPHTGREDVFAYRVTEVVPVVVGGFLHPGGFLVMSRRVRRIEPDRIYAVRLGQRLALGRVALKKNLLLLLPLRGSGDFEAMRVESQQRAHERLAAASVMAVRLWK